MEKWILPFCITISYTVITVFLGLKSRGQMNMRKMENWSISGNTIGVVVTFFLCGAANISAYTFMGAPAWGYLKGVAAFYILVGLSLTAFTGYLAGPRINKLAQKEKIITLAEAYGVRYESKFLRAVTGIVGGLATIGMSVIQIIGVGYILFVMSGKHLPLWAGQLIVLIAIFVYVFISGVRAIGWTNVLQGIMMFILSITVCLLIMNKINGNINLGSVFTAVAEVKPAHLTLPGSLGDMPPVFWTTSAIVTMLSFWPGYWTSYASAKSGSTVRNANIYLPVYYLIMAPMIIVGFISVYAYTEYKGPADSVALSFIMKELPWWVVGLFGAGVLASAQSTSEPQFHTTALTLSHDVIMPFKKEKSGKTEGLLQRWLLLPVMFGIVLPLAILKPANMVYINLFCIGFVVQLTPLLLFGIFLWPRSTKAGAAAGVIAGVIVVIACNFIWKNPLGIHAGIWGWMFNIPIHIIVSLVTRPVKRETLEKFHDKEIVNEFYKVNAAEGISRQG